MTLVGCAYVNRGGISKGILIPSLSLPLSLNRDSHRSQAHLSKVIRPSAPQKLTKLFILTKWAMSLFQVFHYSEGRLIQLVRMSQLR